MSASKTDSEPGTAEPSPSGTASNAVAVDARTGKIRRVYDALSEEVIVEIQGRPVRLTLLLSGELQATMVRPGRFPISNTGFRSVMHGLRSRYLIGAERSEAEKEAQEDTGASSEEEAYEIGKEALSDLAEERDSLSAGVIRTCQESGPDPEEKPVKAITRGTTPSRQKLANTILTAEPEKRPEIIEAGIRQYQRTVRFPEPDPGHLTEHRNWSANRYREKLQKAERTLQMLRAARKNGLFSGKQDLSMALEVASPSVKAAYSRAGCSCEVSYNWSAEACHRRYLRVEQNTSVLTGDALWDLARRLLNHDVTLRSSPM